MEEKKDYSHLTEKDIEDAMKELKFPGVTKYSNGMYKIETGCSDENYRCISIYTWEAGYQLFLKALKERAKKLGS